MMVRTNLTGRTATRTQTHQGAIVTTVSLCDHKQARQKNSKREVNYVYTYNIKGRLENVSSINKYFLKDCT